MTKQQKIMQRHWVNPLNIQNFGKQPKAIMKMMDEWAIEVLRWAIDPADIPKVNKIYQRCKTHINDRSATPKSS